MKYANGAVLEALHLARYRQIPWHKRPPVFTSLQALGLVRPATSGRHETLHADPDCRVDGQG